MEDVPFYVKQAERADGPILELACGTGRVAIPLAEAEYEVWGIDLSREMLAVFEEKRSALPKLVHDRLHISCGDMSRFDLGRRFSLIIIPFRGFQGLTTREQHLGCLRCVRDHLAPDGRLIVDVFRCYTVLDDSWCQDPTFVREVEDPRTGDHIRFSDHRRRIDVDNQVIYPDMIFDIERPDGTREQVVEPLELSYFYEEQMRGLLDQAGLEVVEGWSDYAGTPIGQGPEQIFVCKARQGAR